MLDKRTTSSAWMRGVASTLTAQGLDAAALFADAGLLIEGLKDADRRWSSEAASRMWVLAAERSGNPDIALFNPHLPRPDQYGVVGYAMMSSSDLQEGLTRLIRYLCIVSDAAVISLDPGAGGRWVKLELYGGECPVPRQRYDYGMVTLLTFYRWMLSRPLAAAFRHPVPMSIAAYNEAFEAPLQFDATFNGFLVSDEDLACKLPTALPELAELHDRIAAQALLKFERTDTTHRAREAVAQRYLVDSRVTFYEIAYLLGYADQSTFFRASHRWFGEPPGDYRERALEGRRQEIKAARGG